MYDFVYLHLYMFNIEYITTSVFFALVIQHIALLADKLITSVTYSLKYSVSFSSCSILLSRSFVDLR